MSQKSVTPCYWIFFFIILKNIMLIEFEIRHLRTPNVRIYMAWILDLCWHQVSTGDKLLVLTLTLVIVAELENKLIHAFGPWTCIYYETSNKNWEKLVSYKKQKLLNILEALEYALHTCSRAKYTLRFFLTSYENLLKPVTMLQTMYQLTTHSAWSFHIHMFCIMHGAWHSMLKAVTLFFL